MTAKKFCNTTKHKGRSIAKKKKKKTIKKTIMVAFDFLISYSVFNFNFHVQLAKVLETKQCSPTAVAPLIPSERGFNPLPQTNLWQRHSPHLWQTAAERCCALNQLFTKIHSQGTNSTGREIGISSMKRYHSSKSITSYHLKL